MYFGDEKMSLYELSTIAVALSLDAFGVALSIGLDKSIRKKNKFLFAISFGFFQFLFTFLGAIIGVIFNQYIASVPEVLGGIIIALVGALMIKEGFSKKEEKILLKTGMYFVLGISVSIDAMVLGFTVFNRFSNIYTITAYSIYIGIVTLVISLFGFWLSRILKRISIVSKFADFIGGIILIIFGLKMIFF